MFSNFSIVAFKAPIITGALACCIYFSIRYKNSQEEFKRDHILGEKWGKTLKVGFVVSLDEIHQHRDLFYRCNIIRGSVLRLNLIRLKF